MKFGNVLVRALVAIATSAAVTPLLAQIPSSNLQWQPARPGVAAWPVAPAQALAPVPLAPVPPQVNSGFQGQNSIVTGQPISSPMIVTNQPVMGAPMMGAPVVPPTVYDPYCAPAPVTSGLSAPMMSMPGACCPTPVMPAAPACAYPGFYAFGEFFNREAHFPYSPFAFAPNAAGTVFTPLAAETGDDWGYRIGAGWRFMDGWDVGGAYESFDASGSTAAGENPLTMNAATPFIVIDTGIVLATMPTRGNLFFGTADAVEETRSVDYQLIDLEAGRQFCICETLVLRPFAGVRFASLDHSRTDVYSDFIPSPAVGVAPELDEFTIARSTSIEGIGLRAGNYLGWKFGLSGFQVFARGELSLLNADINVSQSDTFVQNVNGVNGGAPIPTAITFSRDFQQVIPIAEIAAGVRYDFERWSISGGYEVENWFNVVSDVDFFGAVDRGDIGFSGWFVRGAYNF